MEKLKKITGKNPFKVPEKYFEKVNSKIISATSGNYDRTIRRDGQYIRLRPWMTIAASVAVLILFGYLAVRLLTADRINIQVSDASFEEYYEVIINDIDILTLEENATSFDLSGDGPDVSTNEIIDYLLLENIEISDIYEHL